AQLRLGEHEDALDDDHRSRLDAPAQRTPRVRCEVVDRHVDGAAGAQLSQMIGQQAAVERRRMIEVERRALLEPHVAEVAIVRVVLERDAAACRDRGRKLVRDGGLARTGTPGDTHDQRSHIAADTILSMKAVTVPRTCTTVLSRATSTWPTALFGASL